MVRAVLFNVNHHISWLPMEDDNLGSWRGLKTEALNTRDFWITIVKFHYKCDYDVGSGTLSEWVCVSYYLYIHDQKYVCVAMVTSLRESHTHTHMCIVHTTDPAAALNRLGF